MSAVSRRAFVLRGVVAGGAVTLGLPLLDCFLNENGTAMAATLGGTRVPLRFGTWFWGCGMIPNRWVPKRDGADYDLPPQLAPIKDVQQHVTVLSGFDVALGAQSNEPHISGNIGLRTAAPQTDWQKIAAPTLDVLIADAIGSGTVFRAVNLSADGNPRTTYSYRSATAMNAATPTAYELYQQLFGPGFRDPNAATFTPDPNIMVNRSVLSGVGEARRKLLRQVGAADRARLDQYFTSVREIEAKLALQLQKPAPAEACAVPTAAPKQFAAGTDLTDIDTRRSNHLMMAQLLAMALACNQTRVFNLVLTNAANDLHRAGNATGYHQTTHEELIDRSLGYQPTVDALATVNMEIWTEFVKTLAAVKEGPGTLLDNTLVFAHSDVSYAKNHEVGGIPMMIAGTAGGRVKAGIHLRGNGEPTSRVGLTVMQAMGLSIDAWGVDAMRATRPIDALLA